MTCLPDTHAPSERSLVEAARDDPLAFERLYNHYFPRVYAYTLYRVGCVHDGEDLVADVFMKVAEAVRQGTFEWRHEGSFAAWLFRIAHNAVSSYYRHRGRRDEPLALEECPHIEASALLPEDDLLRREEFAHLRRLLTTLSPRRQEVITLRYFAGLHNSEIARVLGLDERTVASHLSRGLDDLHHKYEAGQRLEGRTPR